MRYLSENILLQLCIILVCITFAVIIILKYFMNRKINVYLNELEKTEQDYQSLFHQNPDIIVKMDLSGFIVYSNKAVDEITGYSEKIKFKQHYDKFIAPEYLEETTINFKEATMGTSTNFESAIIHKNSKELIHVNITNLPIMNNGKIEGVYSIVKDNTQQRKAEDMVVHLAYHDYLTGLPNRNMLDNRLSKQLTIAKNENKKTAILFIDLDRFKVINDTLGHSVGDDLLKEVTKCLQSSVSEKDIVFRQGGDEFIIILDNANREVAIQVANRIIENLAIPFNIKNYDIYTSPSIGISLFPDDGDTVETLVKRADSAMYQAKNSGKNTYKFYSFKEDEKSLDPLMLEMELHKAIERNELLLHYQPKINLKSGKIIGTEALLRWNHPKWGIVSPANFIPIAEEVGLIIPIGEWALRTACAQNKKWHDQGLSKVSISVNLSARQFFQSNLVDIVKKTLEETGLDAQYLELEITESMTADIERTISTLHGLKNLGVSISIDDFGTGFSSLNYLKRFPVDTLKIDQSFVRELQSNPHDETIVKTIISMAHSLNLNVVAEGIETKEQLVFLQKHLCNDGQGYFFSKPLPAEELGKIMNELESLVSNFGISQAVNERMWAEDLIRLARTELQETIRLQQGATLKFKKVNGRFIHTLCDGALLYKLGFVPEQILGKDLSEILPEAKKIEKIKYYQRAWDGEKNVNFEAEINNIHYLTSLSPIKRGGEIVEVIGSCVDITDLKKVEKELLESERKYRLIAENTTDLITIYDTQGICLFASPSHNKVIGYKVAHYEGQLITYNVHPEDRTKQSIIFTEILETRKPIHSKMRLAKRVGNWGVFEIVVTPILNEEGVVVQIVRAARAVTEERIAGDLLWEPGDVMLVER